MLEEIEVMRVIRVPPMGKLVVEVAGSRLDSLEEVENGPTRQRLLAAIGELVSFAGGYEELLEAGVAPPLQSPPPEPGMEGASEEFLTEQQARFLDSLERELKAASHQSSETGPLDVDALLEDEPLPAQEPQATPEPEPTLNLVAEIDAILQKHLSTDPKLADRSIHLEQPPGGVLQVVVEGERYDRPTDIDDPHIRRALKKALKEWENR